MDLSSIKSVSPNRKLFKKIMALLFSLAVIIVSFYVLNNANQAAKDTIEVLRVKQEGGLPAQSVLTDKNVEKYSIIKKEYTKDMILSEDLPNITNKLTKYFIRNGSILYIDQLTDEKPQKNEWLYQMNDESEALTLPYNYLEAGGDILMPGDRVRIRVSYEDKESSATNPNDVFSRPSQDKIIKTEVLFESIVVKDMLNANSRSIYEVYKEVLKLSEDKRQEVMKSQEFLKNIQPRALLLEGSREQINKYAKYKGLDGQTLLITILSRNQSDVILDQLPTLQSEVESWLDKMKAQ